MAQQHIQPVPPQTPQSSMRWFFLILVALWIFAAMAISIITFCITKNPLCFAGVGVAIRPPRYALRRIVDYLFKTEKDYEIEAMRIEARKQQKPMQ